MLHGRTGFDQMETDASGRAVRMLARISPVSGQDLSLYLETPEIKKLIKLALDRLSGRIFVDLNTENYTLTLGFENHQERSFFMLLLPPGWQEK